MIRRTHGDKNWTWTPVRMNQRVQRAHVEKSSPRWISSSSSPLKLLPCIPRTNPPPHPPFTPPSALSFSLSLTSVSPPRFPLLRPLSTQTQPPPPSSLPNIHTVYFDFLKCHHQRYCLCFTGWFTTFFCFYGILSEKKTIVMSIHVRVLLDQAEGAPAVCHYCQVSNESEWHTGRLVRESVW